MTIPSPENFPISLLFPNLLLILVPILAVLLIPPLISNKTAAISHIPGPFLARYTDAWSLWLTWKTHHHGNRAATLRTLEAQYGSVVRTGPRSVTVLDPAACPAGVWGSGEVG
jgi:hypothetical protein